MPFSGKDNIRRGPRTLNTDRSSDNKEPGFMTFALNSVLRSSDGNISTPQNEPGNTNTFSLPSGYVPVGSININKGTIIFSNNGTNSEIGLHRDEIYTTLVNNDCLNLFYPIKTPRYRMIRSGERVVYWGDGVNKDRQFNIDKLSNYYSAAALSYIDANGSLSGFVGQTWDCDKFDLISTWNIPDIDLTSVNESGGDLEVGAYYFYTKYIDASNTETEVVAHTNQINIPSGKGNDNEILGGLPSSFSSEDGGVNKTTRSITLDLSGLDTKFSKVRFYVVAYITGDGQTAQVFQVEDIEIPSSGNLTWTFRNLATANKLNSGLADLFVDYIPFDKSNVMYDYDGVLIRAHLEGNYYDWSKFQQAANNITTEYFVQKSNTNNNPKSGEYTFYYPSFMRDEIYAIGIVWVMKDNSLSPVFHVPGRAALVNETLNTGNTAVTEGNTNTHSRPAASTDWDSEATAIPATVSAADARHSGSTSGTKQRWELFNTAIKYNSIFNTGLCGYYETSTAYPSTKGTDGNRIYPTGNIRHHRMPDQMLEPAYDTNNLISTLGLQFANINAPAEHTNDIKGYFFVVGDRNEENKTVLDTGIIEPLYVDSTTGHYTSMPYHDSRAGGTRSNDLFAIYSPKQKFYSDSLNIDYIKAERKINGDIEYQSDEDEQPWHPGGVSNPGNNYTWGRSTVEYEDNGIPTFLHRSVETSVSVENNKRSKIDTNDIILDYRQKALIVELEDSLTESPGTDVLGVSPGSSDTSHYFIVSLKRSKDVYTNLNLIKYRKASTQISDQTTHSIFGGDVYISQFKFKKTARATLWYEPKNSVIVDPAVEEASLIQVYLESEINTELRHEHYNVSLESDGSSVFFDGLVYPKSFSNDLSGYLSAEVQFGEYFGYNQDYNLDKSPVKYLPLPNTYDWTDINYHKRPDLAAYSEKALPDDAADRYRIFKVNNKIETSGREIYRILGTSRSLLMLTDRGTLVLAPNARTLQTNEDVIEVGTGDVFSIPPTKAQVNDYHYGGIQGTLACVETEFGTFYIDANSGEMFNLTSNGIKNIGGNMSKWLNRNLPSALSQHIYNTIQQENIYYDDPNHTGVFMYFDPVFNRIITTKKDYIPLFTYTAYDSGASYVDGDYYLRDGKFYKIVSSVETAVSYNDPDEFEDASWTLSFSPEDNGFVSFHSYFPNFYMNTSSYLYTANGSNTIWRHEADNTYQSFYGTKYDWIIDFVVHNTPQTYQFGTLQYFMRVYNNKVPVHNVSFDKAVFYTDDQCSGELTLTVSDNNPYTNTAWSATNKEVHITDKNHKISGIVDQVNDHSEATMLHDWTNRKTYAGWIDSVVNTNILDTAMNFYNTPYIKDKFINVRLISKHASDYQLIFSLFSHLRQPSIR